MASTTPFNSPSSSVPPGKLHLPLSGSLPRFMIRTCRGEGHAEG